MNTLSPVVASYLAGLIDGEGYIGVTATRTSASAKGCRRGVAYRCHLAVSMCERQAIEWAQEQTGVGVINPKKASTARSRPAFQWNVWSSEAKDLLVQLVPFLLVKREQAENLIQFHAAMRFPGSKGLTDAEWDFRRTCWERSRELNRRGVSNVEA